MTQEQPISFCSGTSVETPGKKFSFHWISDEQDVSLELLFTAPAPRGECLPGTAAHRKEAEGTDMGMISVLDSVLPWTPINSPQIANILETNKKLKSCLSCLIRFELSIDSQLTQHLTSVQPLPSLLSPWSPLYPAFTSSLSLVLADLGSSSRPPLKPKDWAQVCSLPSCLTPPRVVLWLTYEAPPLLAQPLPLPHSSLSCPTDLWSCWGRWRKVAASGKGAATGLDTKQ